MTKKRIVSAVLALAMSFSAVSGLTGTAFAVDGSRTGNQNYYSNQGELNEAAFVSLPMGAVQAQEWLQQQLFLQKHGLTGQIMDLYPKYSEDSGWRGGNGESWETTAYYMRGLVSLAFVLNDDELKAKAMEWLDFSLDNQRDNGFFGPLKDGDGSGDGWDWWPRMVVIQAIRDYYEATEYQGTPDERVLPFFEQYFRYQAERLKSKPLESWAASRGGDNIEVVLWYYNRAYDSQAPEASEWILELAKTLSSQTKSQDSGSSWYDIFTTTTVREHVVNTTQAMKTPAVMSQIPGYEAHRSILKDGMLNVGIDHGRVDGLANADEGARENLPYRGAELCSVVESALSSEITMRILGEGWVGDQMEKTAYNSLPAGYTPDFTGHNYFQAQNQVMLTHGSHEFSNDYGDSCAFGAPTACECCFPNMHMGWPKFIQSMWMATADNGLALTAYGPNRVTAKVADGKTAVFTQETRYPFNGDTQLTYSGVDAEFELKLRVPGWCENPQFSVNGQPIDFEIENGFITILRSWAAGDTIEIEFPMEICTSAWYNNATAVERGPLIFGLKVEEDWRVVEGDDTRAWPTSWYGEFAMREVYPASKWNYGLVYDTIDPNASFTVEVADEIPLQPFTTANAPVVLKVTGQEIPQWQLRGNVVPEPPYSPIQADDSLQTEVELIPYGCGRIRVTQMPFIGEAQETVVRTAESAKTTEEDGERMVEFANVVVPSAEDYTLKISYNGAGKLHLRLNSQYHQELTFSEGGEPLVIENLTDLLPGVFDSRLNQMMKGFKFDYGQFNNVRFYGNDDVEITQIEVIPVNPFTTPEITTVQAGLNGTSLLVETNIQPDNGPYVLRYGTESGAYPNTADGFRGKTAKLTGLAENTTYYIQAVAMVNGREVPSNEASITTQKMDIDVGDTPEFYDDFSNALYSEAMWTSYGANGLITYEDGMLKAGGGAAFKMAVGNDKWTDYAVEAKLSTEYIAERNYGVIVRATDLSGASGDSFNGYYIGIGRLNSESDYGLIVGMCNGNWNGIANVPIGSYEEGKVYDLKVLAAGSSIVIFVDGEEKYTIKNAIYGNGRPGLRAYLQSFVCDEFRVRELTDAEKQEFGVEDDPVVPPIVTENPEFSDDFSNPAQSQTNWKLFDPQQLVSFETGKVIIGEGPNVKLTAGSESWKDYVLEAKLTSAQEANNNYGVIVRSSQVTNAGADSFNGYYAGIGKVNAGSYGLNIGMCNGNWNGLATIPIGEYEAGKVYDLKVIAAGSTIAFYVDGQKLYTIENAVYDAGCVGLRSYMQPFECHGFSVRELTDEEKDQFGIGGGTVEELLKPDFTDDFEDNNRSAQYWKPVGDLSKMTFADGKFHFGESGNVKAVIGQDDWTDYVMEATVNLSNLQNNAGLIYRVTKVSDGPNNLDGYYYGIGSGGVLLGGFQNNSWFQSKLIDSIPIEAGVDYRLKAVVSGTRIALYLDDELVARFADDKFESGKVGFRGYAQAFTADNVVIREPNAEDMKVFEGLSEFEDGVESAFESAQIKYASVKGASSYKIVYGTEPGQYTHASYELPYIMMAGAPFTKSSVSGLENGKTYYMRVSAVGNTDELRVSDELTVTVGKRSEPTEERAKLEEALAQAGQIENNNYTNESWARLIRSIEYAQSVIDRASSNLMDCNLANRCLTIARKELVQESEQPVEEADKSYLKALVETFDSYDETRYTQDSWAVLQGALHESAKAIDDMQATQAEVDNAYLTLVKARDGLEYAPDRSLLELAIELAQNLLDNEELNLTQGSIDALTAVIDEAAALLSGEVSQDEINAMYEDVMLEITAVVEEEPVDKTALAELIDRVESLTADKYTAASWAVQAEALTAAKKVLDDDTAAEDAVKAACKQLTDAMTSLVLKADFSALKTAYNLAQTLVAEGKYDESTFGNLGELMDEAETILADDESTQAAIDELAAELTVALSRIRLAKEIEIAESALDGLNAGDYTEASWTLANGLIDGARASLEEGATAAELEEAILSIVDIKSNLTPMTEPIPVLGRPAKAAASKTSGDDYWNGILAKINSASEGDAVNAKLEDGAMMPALVLDTAEARGVNLNLTVGSQEVKIFAEHMEIDAAAVYYHSAELIAMAGQKGSVPTEKNTPAATSNPETGGEAIGTAEPAAPEAVIPAEPAVPEAPMVLASGVPAENTQADTPAAETNGEFPIWLIVTIVVIAVATVAGVSRFVIHRRRGS